MYSPSNNRYDNMTYNRCGKSGLLLPAISLGLWHNFGNVDDVENARNIICAAFDRGITHFDLANNYGPPAGEAEKTFGKILRESLAAHRDELIISSKAGYNMWSGPYGEWGSKKHLIASCNQSLQRIGIEYVDIFYSHRYDPHTPLEETMMALDTIVRNGKALYAGISSYTADQSREAFAILKKLGTPCIIHQPKYSMLERWVEKSDTQYGESLLDVLGTEEAGCIAFSPLAQGLLTDKYLQEIPSESRVGRGLTNGAIDKSHISDPILHKVKRLNIIANNRNQSLAQMAITWLLKDKRITSVLIGASSVGQLNNNVDALKNVHFSEQELVEIEKILSE
jgi:L-glyceraldehyde 3-phosphate reductase